MVRLCPCTKRTLVHKQPAVPGDEHGDATKVDNSSVDEVSQGPSKCRCRKKSEIDRPFSCSVCGKKYGALYYCVDSTLPYAIEWTLPYPLCY